MNKIRELLSLGLSPKEKASSVKPNRRFQLFDNSEENKAEAKPAKKVENKLEKYRKKYHEQRHMCNEEILKAETFIGTIKKNQQKIESLQKEIKEKQHKNQILETKISENKAKTEEILRDMQKLNPNNFDASNEFSEKAPSLSSLQFENLKEKLNAKNKRVKELEHELLLEQTKTEALNKEITLLRIELSNYQ